MAYHNLHASGPEFMFLGFSLRIPGIILTQITVPIIVLVPNDSAKLVLII